MTVIQKIRMKGFKSFARPLELPFGNGFNIIIGANGSGKSLKGDSKVILETGEEIEIESLVNSKLREAEEIKKLEDGVYCDNKENIKILSLNPKFMRLEEKKISKFVRRGGDPYLFEIKTRSGKKVSCTGCHPVMVFKNGAIVSSLVKDLKKEDLIASPRVIHTNSTFKDKDFARLFGYVLGDGYITHNRVEFVNKDEELIKDFKNLLLELFNAECKYEKKFNSITRLIYWNKNIVNRITSLLSNKSNKYTSEYKYIPNYFMTKDRETIANLLAGLYDTDGTIDKNKDVIEFCSKSENLADQIQRLLLRFDIIARKKGRLCSASNTEKKIKREYFYLYIEGQKNLEQFYKNIPLKCKYKKKRMEEKLFNKKSSNPNIDLLPRETNKLIKKAINLLGIKVKPTVKEYPKLRAYLDNRCSPTRGGLKEILPLLNNKLLEIYISGLKLKHDQSELVEVMDQLFISGRKASQALGLNQGIIRDSWATNKFKAKPENLDKFFDFIQSAITGRLTELRSVLNTLHSLAYSDIFWDEIAEIKKVKGESYVYDLTVEGNHNFVGNGLFVHNSNVMDALCFVFGKISAKSMRAEKSANLLYNGGKTGTPAKLAEVCITLDNSKKTFPIETQAVEISRIVNQKGNSLYRINGEKRTRQQVLDLLYSGKIDPDGHNIVMQGDIIRFMEMASEERREVIEEISGIGIYEDKKHKAMNELEKVEVKLSEANIILKEREAHLRELKKDRDHALKFKEIQEKIKSTKATHLNLQIKERENKRDDIDKKIGKTQDEINKINEKINELKKKIDGQKEEIGMINADIEEKSEKEQIKLQKDVSDLKTNIVKNEERLNSCKNEITKIKSRKEQLEITLDENNSKIKDLENERNEIQKKINFNKNQLDKIENDMKKFMKEHNIKDADSMEKTLEEIDNKIDDSQREIQGILEKKQELIREKDRIEIKVNNIDEELNKINDVQKQNQGKLNELSDKKQEFKKITLELNKTLNEFNAISSQLNKSRRELVVKQEDYAKERAKQAGLEESLRGDSALRKVLELKKSIKGIYGTIYELGKVEKKYALALEIAAGMRMKSVVVDNEITAAKCINILKENKLGVATFLPLNKIKTRIISEDEKKLAKETHGFALGLIKFDNKYSNAFNYVFGGTIIVNDLQEARKLGVGRGRFVTLDGDLVEPSGAMVGGYRRSNLGISFKEKDDNLKYVELEFNKLKGLVDDLEQRKIENEEKISSMREQKSIFESDILRIEAGLGLKFDPSELKEKKKELFNRLKEFDSDLNKVENEIKAKNKEFYDFKVKRDQIIENITKSRGKGKGALGKFEEQKSLIREELIRLEGEFKNINNQLGLVNPEKESVNKILKEQEKEIKEFSEEINRLEKELGEQGNSLKDKERKEKLFYSDYKNLFVKRNKINEEMQKREIIAAKKGEEIKVFENKVNTFNLDRAKIIAELEGLQYEFKNFEDVPLRKGINSEELKNQIRDFENMINRMGNINMRALEIYEGIEKEYHELTKKSSKLNEEKEDILKLMNEIEGNKKSLFLKSFNDVNDSFKGIFSQISTKGDAFLQIENEENPFEGGVMIKVRLSGNKFMDIHSLSGGEKTLTALAFIFAIQEHQPASFYLFDEVDAALDKRNSAKLSEYIRKYSDKAQYIVISHNDAVITDADQIYGVSMQQDGISKVVSLKI